MNGAWTIRHSTTGRFALPAAAALQGFALGGGLNWRLPAAIESKDDAALSLGLPEVLLGLHPGFGGTVRTVRLIGVRAALELMLRVGPSRGPRAQCGLLDGSCAGGALARAKSCC